MAKNELKLLRGVYFTEELIFAFDERAAAEKMPVGELLRRFVDEGLSSPDVSDPVRGERIGEPRYLRSLYVPVEMQEAISVRAAAEGLSRPELIIRYVSAGLDRPLCRYQETICAEGELKEEPLRYVFLTPNTAALLSTKAREMKLTDAACISWFIDLGVNNHLVVASTAALQEESSDGPKGALQRIQINTSADERLTASAKNLGLSKLEFVRRCIDAGLNRLKQLATFPPPKPEKP